MGNMCTCAFSIGVFGWSNCPLKEEKNAVNVAENQIKTLSNEGSDRAPSQTLPGRIWRTVSAIQHRYWQKVPTRDVADNGHYRR